MPERAKITRTYLGRTALMAAICVGFSLWFLYDGTFTYPQQRERALAYEELVKDRRGDEWKEFATERGWPTDDPGIAKEEAEITVQLILAGVAAVGAIPFFIILFRNWGTWIEGHESGIRTSWGRELEFSEIKTLDKKKWKAKGIAKVRYEREGRKRRIVLDDWKYDTEPTVEILRAVEAHIDISQIVRGRPEPPPEEEADEAEAAVEGTPEPSDSTTSDKPVEP